MSIAGPRTGDLGQRSASGRSDEEKCAGGIHLQVPTAFPKVDVTFAFPHLRISQS
jgi:hypothetical protein